MAAAHWWHVRHRPAEQGADIGADLHRRSDAEQGASCGGLSVPSVSTAASGRLTYGRAEDSVEVDLAARPTSIKTLEWGRIREMLAATAFNVSETARRLGMHRRTLARKLGKWPVK